MTFYRLLFWLAFQLALERHFFALGTEKPPKMEPKPSQNPVENASKIDLMLRTLKSESEQTLLHFCSFLPLRAPRKSSQNRLQIGPGASLAPGAVSGLMVAPFWPKLGAILNAKVEPCWGHVNQKSVLEGPRSQSRTAVIFNSLKRPLGAEEDNF